MKPTTTTKKAYTGKVSGPGHFKLDHTIPAGARVSPNGGGSYWLEDINLIDSSGDRFDAVHYGFIIPASHVD